MNIFSFTIFTKAFFINIFWYCIIFALVFFLFLGSHYFNLSNSIYEILLSIFIVLDIFFFTINHNILSTISTSLYFCLILSIYHLNITFFVYKKWFSIRIHFNRKILTIFILYIHISLIIFQNLCIFDYSLFNYRNFTFDRSILGFNIAFGF